MSHINIEIFDVTEINFKKYNLNYKKINNKNDFYNVYKIYGLKHNIIKFLTEIYCLDFDKTDNKMLKKYIKLIKN